MNSKICAYIDILGFSNIVKSDLGGASRLLTDYQGILEIKKSSEVYKGRYEGEKDVTSKSLFEKSIIIDSFEYFIPFSDSALIIANNPSRFVFQISSFLLAAFMFGGYMYGDYHDGIRSDLLEVDVPAGVNKKKEKWYPLLFQGGVSFGECNPLKISQIANSKLEYTYNTIGMAVVEAVRLKGKDKGPRLFCTAEFYENLTDEESRQIVIPTESKDIYEILWVMPYIKESPSGINECREMLEISLNLWQYFNHKDFGVHYFRFLELVVRSILESYKNSDDDFKRAIDTIIAIFENKHEDIRKISHILDRYKR